MPTAPKPYRPRRGTTTPAYRPRERRLPSSQRGYLDGWPALRDHYKARHPYCEDCPYPRAQYVEVDHIIPFSGLNDPLRLEERNLRTRCAHHHRRKTAALDGEIRAFFDRTCLAIGFESALRATTERYREVMRERPR